jgi:hypothetical protein
MNREYIEIAELVGKYLLLPSIGVVIGAVGARWAERRRQISSQRTNSVLLAAQLADYRGNETAV